MSSLYRRIYSNKLLFAIALIIFSYFILRGIAWYKHEIFVLQGEYFTFQDKKVRYLCQGSGHPYVILETGFGNDSEEVWSSIANQLPSTFTTCYYDRLGHGGSDDVPTTFTTEQKSQLQESLIKHIAGDSPVVLVAKSYGGIIARRTTARENINLAALLLLDSAHENQHEVLRGIFDPISDTVKNLQYINATLGLFEIKNIFNEYNSDRSKRLAQYYAGFRWAHVLSTYRNEKGFYTPLENFNYDFGDLKLVVMSHDREAYASRPRFYSMGEKWAKMQQSLAKLSTNSEHMIVNDATHNITGDAPEVVIAKIKEAVEYVNNQFSRNVTNASGTTDS
ncbi:alpha/beta fold hydrolase [Thalassotalea hakodatensis]|uniref:alpha/beta fold hydrolase n=1 Tax=Thalassotalea hakodatensis TaxID=3030492 RepID=UPI002572A1EA|nr:alpha/beta hydrolase [Thalassotalea hakodatensis]